MNGECLKAGGELLANYKTEATNAYVLKLYLRSALAGQGFNAKDIKEVVEFLFEGKQ